MSIFRNPCTEQFPVSVHDYRRIIRSTEQIFRQAQSSAIIRAAHAVNGGSLPPLKNLSDSDFFFLSRRDPQSVLDTIVDLCRRRLPERMGIPADQIQVLSPTRRRGTGTRALNQALQEAEELYLSAGADPDA